MISEPRPDDLEPISPELVLVSSPEAARRARDELPPPPEAEIRPSTATAQDRVPEPPRYPRMAIEEPFAEPAAPRRRIRLLLAACALGVVGAAAWWVGVGRDDEPTDRVANVPASPSARNGTTVPSAPGAGTQTTKAVAPAGGEASPHAKAQPRPGDGKPAQKPKTGTAATKVPVGFVPARAWAWTASKGARGYIFRMARNGHVVLRIRTKRPRLVLPKSFRFHAGKYRWTVRRVPAPSNGRLLAASSFVLTAAGAARAND